MKNRYITYTYTREGGKNLKVKVQSVNGVRGGGGMALFLATDLGGVGWMLCNMHYVNVFSALITLFTFIFTQYTYRSVCK